jgi:hypothetical protein
MFQSLTTHWTAWLSQASFGQITLISGSMLIVSNVFMTWAWYGHLKHLADKPWWWAALISWGIAWWARFTSSLGPKPVLDLSPRQTLLKPMAAFSPLSL